jgi:hypothetical protein
MSIQRRTVLKGGLTGLAWAASQRVAEALQPTTRFVIHVSGPAGGPIDNSYSPLIAELDRRGYPVMLVHSPVAGSRTPNADRAAAIVHALQDVTDQVAIIGVSNEGNVLPLVAAARPVRRLVYVNALIPRPGSAFVEVCQTEKVAVPDSLLDKLLKASQDVTDDFLKIIHDPGATRAQLQATRDRIDASPAARTIVGFYEVCPLAVLPDADNVCVSGSADDQIRPEWEQSAARRALGVEPVIVSGAGHATLVTQYATQLADACVAGL